MHTCVPISEIELNILLHVNEETGGIGFHLLLWGKISIFNYHDDIV
jgi:hypothetical protein